MNTIERKIKTLEKEHIEFKSLLDFSNIHKGSIITYVPNQTIELGNIMGFNRSQKPTVYKAVVKEYDTDNVICQIHKAKYVTESITFDRTNGRVSWKTGGMVVNKKFRNDIEFILRAIQIVLKLEIYVQIKYYYLKQ